MSLRSLLPLDETMILESVKTTGRVLVVHEHASRGGFAGELMALINQEAFDYLDAPIKRVSSIDAPQIYSMPLEQQQIPNVARIVDTVLEIA